MKICALSDPHGCLLNPETFVFADVVIICGDIVPLEYQRMDIVSDDWFRYDFCNWVNSLNCKKVIFTPGNHDFYLYKHTKDSLKQMFEILTNGKAVYLEDELYEYEGVTFYGCPWTTGPEGWAFAPDPKKGISMLSIEDKYLAIPKCDILITHNAPHIGNVGTSNFDKPNAKVWGSDFLASAVKNVNPDLHFFGHIHSGDHCQTPYPTYGCDTKFYNVSILDERYDYKYVPLIIEYDKNTKTIIDYGQKQIFDILKQYV